MKLLKKHWLGTLLFLLWVALIIFFDPAQRLYYLNADVEKFQESSNLVLIILEIILLCYIVILAIRQKVPGKRTFTIVAYVGMILFFVFFFGHQTFTSIGLFINRQTDKTRLERSYVVGYLDDDKRNTNTLFLRGLGVKDVSFEEQLLGKVRHFGFNALDTIQVGFKNGLFGVDYFDKPSISRK